jgi:hypothetical protein
MRIFKFCKPKINKYILQGQVQYDEHDNLTNCGCAVRFLDEYKIFAKTEERAMDKVFKLLKRKYPEYGDKIMIG